MSSLLVDVGNSRVKWAFKQGRSLQAGKPLCGRPPQVDLDVIWKDLDPPSRILVSNVLGADVQSALEQWFQDRWARSAEFIRSDARGYGVENGYRNASQLGVDRWLAMIAARALCKAPVMIVDCGTAITVDVLDAAGRHQGGVICPGLMLMQEALLRGAPKLSLEGSGSGSLLARDTGSGIYNGTLTAAAGLIEKCLADAEESLHSKLQLIVTGGDADSVAGRLRTVAVTVPDLVLQGLSVIETQHGSDGL
ncbi:MAG: type III pantothenate kinase [Gammaproteobacteria bacterium]